MGIEHRPNTGPELFYWLGSSVLPIRESAKTYT